MTTKTTSKTRAKKASTKAKGRRNIPEPERRKVWVSAGGRCTLCKRYLMEGGLTYQEMVLGEAAHLVGQTTSQRSPRGLDPLPESERDKAENLMLACGACHDEIDQKLAVGLMTIEKLRTIKRGHEDLIRHLTGMVPDQRTVVVRMLGRVRGNEVELHRDSAAAAVLRSDNRFPDFPLSYDRHGVEIDLRHLPGEADATPQYYAAAKGIIDEVIGHKLSGGVVKDQVHHLSVFAFARLPLLVYLGSKLDDTIPTEIYQRHRAGESWDWGAQAEIVGFQAVPVGDCVASGMTEAILIVNVSGTIQVTELPNELESLPAYQLHPTTGTPGPDMLRRRESLANFVSAVRGFFSSLEQDAKTIRKLHVFGALPISAAVALGRAHDPQVHPTLTIYDRTRTGYLPVLEIP